MGRANKFYRGVIMYNREKVIDMVYGYVKEMDKLDIADNLDEIQGIYKQGMQELERCYKNREIGYSDYEWLQDVLAHVN